ncbi:MAG: hypothetical protein LAT81_05755 [Oceanicaulis sp.]|nr:hypothetical protein [Oceanicaulis sp.]
MAWRNAWKAVSAGGLLASGSAQAQVLDLVEAGAHCPSGIGCQIAMDSGQGSLPAQACQGEEAITAQADGERLLVMIRSPEPPQSISGSLATRHIDPIGEACWAAQWRLPHLAQSRLQFYAFDAQGGRLGQAVFEGDRADPAAGHGALSAPIDSFTLFDGAAGIERRVHVYIPPQLGNDRAPVLILPDGQAIRQYAGVVQHLIDNSRIPPVLIVAIEARMDTPFARNHEYVPSRDSDMHQSYLSFFENEFLPWIATQYGGRVSGDGWILFGASASATFALSASRVERYINRIIAASPAPSDVDVLQDAPRPFVQFHIAAGLYEARFREAADSYADRLRAHAVPLRTLCYASGHDRFTWEAALRDGLIDIFSDGRIADRSGTAEACPG